MSDALTLRTERLDLPPLDASHLDELAAIYADPAVSAYIGGSKLSYEGTRAQLAVFEAIWREHGHGQSAVIERASGRMIGRAGLHHWPGGMLELGYVLARDAQGKGYAREAGAAWLAWTWANLPNDHITAVIHPENTASITLAARLGFHFDHRTDQLTGTTVSIYRLDRPPAA
ncbi:GNAT family N-acetyltransferase [Phytohabitans houttuyneae]|uniref:N-acetyltransferase n=1 Tax=Phytohabitans houttuyneae TaxID=1076126 RepID=A0A6V8KLV0_9ACTN|nr:GNAT family N-acetyltransferase [Phytohabitans houttuyneae]GFJ86172.1 N-acetyltransferase [Phytohabitans houttuyneae]